MKEEKKSFKKWVFILFIIMVLAMFYKTNQWANKGEKSGDSKAVAVAPQMSNTYYLQVDQRDATENRIPEAKVYTLHGTSGDVVSLKNFEQTWGSVFKPLMTITRTIQFNYKTLQGQLIMHNDLDGKPERLPLLLARDEYGVYTGMLKYRDGTVMLLTLTPKTW